jgi:hypothetical protein
MAIREGRPLKDVTGRYLTKALFVELTDREMAEKYPPLCTIKEAHDLYMEIADPTEYKFAKALLYSETTTFWDHWHRLIATTDFVEYLMRWREELDASIKSNAIETLKTQSMDSTVAAKWLAEKGYLGKRKAGRPSKQEIDNEKKIQASSQKTLEDDAQRISLTH